jgi:D-erythritol 1-phosphate dehydrogenase
MKGGWTANASLPGGDMPFAEFDGYLPMFQKKHPWLPLALARHYARLYGTRARLLLDGVSSVEGLGRHFGGLLYEAELDYLKRQEWAQTADDVLDRRTKHRLHLTEAEQAEVAKAF